MTSAIILSEPFKHASRECHCDADTQSRGILLRHNNFLNGRCVHSNRLSSFAMSKDSDEAARPDWSNIDAFDPRPVTEFDPCPDNLDDLSSWWLETHGEVAHVSQILDREQCSIRSKSMVQRRPYGQGRDAHLTARYRGYRVGDSAICSRLQRFMSPLTKRIMLNLIEGALANCPEDIRPRPPTRTQKRVLGGLIAWTEDNASFLMRYMCSHVARN
jgi:hypothetical protein